MATSGCIHDGWLSLSPKSDNTDPDYLFQILSSPDTYRKFERLASGATVKNLNIDLVRGVEIPLPPLDEQRRIAAILDQVDTLRRQRREALSRLSGLTRAIFLDMFGDWSRPGQTVPVVKIGPRLDFLTSGSRGWAEYYKDRGSTFLRIQNVRHDELDLRDVAFVAPPETAEANRTRVRPGDVLLSITADLGRTAVVPDDIGEAFINQHLSILRTEAFVPRFLSAALSSPAGQRAILSRNREGVKAGLNFDDIRSFEVPDVDRKRQLVFAKRAAETDGQKALQSDHLALLNALFASLQHRAFHGEL
jgi:type I restriction enzyme S subunit